MNGHHGTALSALPDDIVEAHILTYLDGVSLSSLTRASSHLRSITAAYDKQLWSHVCTSTWPSTSDPRVQHAIASFPNRHRGFFSKSYPLLTGHVTPNLNRPSSPPPLTQHLISAVDIYYKKIPVFSRVQETETISSWFTHSPFRIDLLGPKESVRVGLGPVINESELELSWIMIDPVRKVSARVSSLRHVATERHWLTGEVGVKYSTVVGGERVVEVEVRLMEGEVKEVGMRVEDVEGKWMNGKESLRVLGEVMECGERKVGSGSGSGGEGYEEFLERKRVWREEKERREMKMGMITCIGVGVGVGVGVVVFLGFCMGFFVSM